MRRSRLDESWIMVTKLFNWGSATATATLLILLSALICPSSGYSIQKKVAGISDGDMI